MTAGEPKAADQGGELPRRRRKAGRFRRWLLRPLVWLLVGLLAVVAAAYLYSRTDAAHERARRLLLAQLEAYLGRPVEIAAVDYSLLRPGLTVRGLVVASPEGFDRPFARAALVEVELGLRGGWQRIKLNVRRVEVSEPEVNVLLAADGSSNLPSFGAAAGEGGGRLEVRLGTVVVHHGLLRLSDLEIPLDLEARQVWGQLTGPPGPLNAAGREPTFAFQGLAEKVTTTLPGAVPYTGALTVRGTVTKGRADLEAGRLTGPDLAAHFNGHVDWAGERAEARVEIDADGALALANRLGYLGDPIRGRFGFVGEVNAAGGAWTYRGSVRSPEIGYLGRRFTAVAADLAGRAAGPTGEAGELTVDLLGAGYAGGKASGRLTVQTGGEPYPMHLAARLTDAALAPLLADQEIDLPRVTGQVDGELTYDFTSADPRAGSGQGSLVLSGVQRRPGAVPVSGQAPLVIEHGVVTSDAVALMAPGQRVAGSASLDLATGTGRVAFQLASSDLGGLSPILPWADDPDFTPWLPTAGSGTIEGDLALDSSGTAGTLSLDLRQPVTPTLAVDSLSGSLRLAPGAIGDLRLEATLGGGAMMVTGGVPLTANGPALGSTPAPDSSLDLAFDAADWPAASLAFLLPQPPPVDLGGKVSGRVTLSGDFDALAGTADVRAAPLVLSGFEIDRAAAVIAFDPARVAVDSFTAELPAGTVAVNGVWDLATDALDFAATAPALDLAAAPLAGVLPGRLGGRLALQAVIAGTFDDPAATLNLTGEDLTLGGQPLGDRGGAYLDASWRDREVSAQGSLLGLFDFSGGGRLERDAADLSISISSDQLAELVELATSTTLPDLAGSFTGTLAIQGDPRAPAALTARLELDRLTARYQGHAVANLEPVVARLAGGELSLDSVYLGEEGEPAAAEPASDLFVGGTVGFKGPAGAPAALALHVQSSLSAAWAKLVVPQVDVDGKFEVLATVGGTTDEPRVNGQGEMRGGRVLFAGFPHSFENLTATVLFYPQQVVLDSVAADFAGGHFRGAGRVGLDRLAEGEFDYRFQGTATGVSVRYPEGFLLRGDANFSLTSTADGRQIVGSADLDRAFYLEDVPVRVSQLLQRFLQRQRVEAGETDEDLASTLLNLTVRGPGALRVHNNLADLRGDVDLSIRGTLANPVVFGTVEASPGGKIVYADNDYKVERARLTFANPYKLDPAIDLVATTEVRDYDITLQLSGTLERLDVNFLSDPPLADLDVLALLTTGQTVGQESLGGASTAGGTAAAGGAQSFLYGQAASVVTERVNQLFGFDRLRVNPITGSGGGGTAVAFTVGKQLSRDLYVTYSRDPTSSLDYVLQAEWTVAAGVTLVLTQNGSDSYAVDVRWEHRF